jgi:hypothetical protein
MLAVAVQLPAVSPGLADVTGLAPTAAIRTNAGTNDRLRIFSYPLRSDRP